MKCRTCRYDLRGQTSPRCPECGTRFDFDDPSTYIGDRAVPIRRILGRASVHLLEARWVVGLMLLGELLLAWGSQPLLYHDGTRPVHIFICSDLRMLLQEWELQKSEKGPAGKFDQNAAMATIGPREACKNTLIEERKAVVNTYYVKWFVVPALLFAFVLACVCWAVNRMRAVFWSGVALALFVIGLALAIQVHRARSSVPSNAYMSDFVFLDDVNNAPTVDGLSVVAYERTPFPDGWQCVGFSDGTVKDYRAAQVQELLAGMPKREGD